MEYIFGRDGVRGVELLKTKGGEHTDLSGYTEVSREYSDCVIMDSFCIIEKTASTEDEAGNCYDWYYIDHHYRYLDRNPSIRENRETVEQSLTDLYLDGVQAQQDITEIQLQLLGG